MALTVGVIIFRVVEVELVQIPLVPTTVKDEVVVGFTIIDDVLTPFDQV